MARTGPITKDSSTVALGLAQIRIGTCETYIGQIRPILGLAASIGALADTKFMSTVEVFKLESGFPMLEDAVFPLREGCSLECGFKEITPYNLALARGLDPTAGGYADEHLGNIGLGSIAAPLSVRMEAIYTYPDGVNTMTIVFPRCQVVASLELDFASEEPAAVSITLESKRADGATSWINEAGGTTNGHTIWDAQPLGRVLWDDGTGSTSTSTTTTTS
ncbi:MAG: hypothetical protein DRQ42_00200 [Gammaproteobacteria bacterium]|nr:MAG: hypothetical protein DRQ42_00200 [Gammaproteobacteria bacterium]